MNRTPNEEAKREINRHPLNSLPSVMSSKNVNNILDTLCLRSLGVKKKVEKKFISDKWESDNSLYKKVSKNVRFK